MNLFVKTLLWLSVAALILISMIIVSSSSEGLIIASFCAMGAAPVLLLGGLLFGIFAKQESKQIGWGAMVFSIFLGIVGFGLCSSSLLV